MREISKNVQESRLKWYGHTCIENIRRICGQECDGDGKCRGKEREEDRSVGGWITSITTCRRES